MFDSLSYELKNLCFIWFQVWPLQSGPASAEIKSADVAGEVIGEKNVVAVSPVPLMLFHFPLVLSSIAINDCRFVLSEVGVFPKLSGEEFD